MPELPEVETIRRDLRSLVRGRTIVEAWVSPDAPKLVQIMPPDQLCRALRWQRIEDLDRRGKYLLFRLASGLVWIVHLRMTGSLQHHANSCPDQPHLRARFGLEDGIWLCYRDLRKLGMMWLVDDESTVVGKLGPEPLGDGFGPPDLRWLLKRRSAPVKAVLLDQTAIAGIGNIYADEALFAAKINPGRAANGLSARASDRLHAAIRQVLVEAVGNRGSSFRDYVDGGGREGMHHLRVRVFRRTDQPCYDCGTPIRRVKVGGRSTHFCPRCQR
jgi:formamidopyrimidine-DNA glycosylase